MICMISDGISLNMDPQSSEARLWRILFGHPYKSICRAYIINMNQSKPINNKKNIFSIWIGSSVKLITFRTFVFCIKTPWPRPNSALPFPWDANKSGSKWNYIDGSKSESNSYTNLQDGSRSIDNRNSMIQIQIWLQFQIYTWMRQWLLVVNSDVRINFEKEWKTRLNWEMGENLHIKAWILTYLQIRKLFKKFNKRGH